jgi:hypothetical protein
LSAPNPQRQSWGRYPRPQRPTTRAAATRSSATWSSAASASPLWLLGPPFNIEGRFHFSVVEWFAHWHDDEFGISYDWALDRHGGGIGPLFRPHEMTSRFYDDIVRPVGRIWFASDACSRLARRWIEGVIESAVTNAYAIHTGMRDALLAAT